VPFLCVTAAVTLRTLVGTVLSPALMRVRSFAMDHDTALVRRLTSARLLRLAGPVLLTAVALVASAPSWADVVRHTGDGEVPGPDALQPVRAGLDGLADPERQDRELVPDVQSNQDDALAAAQVLDRTLDRQACSGGRAQANLIFSTSSAAGPRSVRNSSRGRALSM